MEAERRLQEITENNKMMFKEEPFNIHGGHEMHNMQQQQVINDLLLQIHTPHSIKKPKPLFPQDPVLQQHLRAVETSEQSRRQEPASSSSNNDPESSHEPNGPVGRPRNEHGVPTESRKDPFIGNLSHSDSLEHSHQTEDGDHLILTLYSKRDTSKTINKKHYSKELFYLLGDLYF